MSDEDDEDNTSMNDDCQVTDDNFADILNFRGQRNQEQEKRPFKKPRHMVLLSNDASVIPNLGSSSSSSNSVSSASNVSTASAFLGFESFGAAIAQKDKKGKMMPVLTALFHCSFRAKVMLLQQPFFLESTPELFVQSHNSWPARFVAYLGKCLLFPFFLLYQNLPSFSQHPIRRRYSSK
jgi:hypothetical protein